MKIIWNISTWKNKPKPEIRNKEVVIALISNDHVMELENKLSKQKP